MNARQAIPGLVRRIVLDGDWKDAPLVLADALEEVGRCREAKLLRTRWKWLSGQVRISKLFVEKHCKDNPDEQARELQYRIRSIRVFLLYVARRFAPEFVPGLLGIAGLVMELRILPDPAGVQLLA